jgi:AraC family transcriptional regulator
MTVRGTTLDDYHRRLDRVRAHLEQHLADPPDLAELARIAGLSPFHFHRVFRALTGEPVGEYQRRIRIERAALLLRHTDQAVTAVGLAVGYESPAAFSRAFARTFSLSPAAWRASAPPPSPAPVASPAPAPIQPMRFVDRRPSTVWFVRRHGPYPEAAPAAWAALMGTVSWRLFLQFPAELIGVCHDDPEITAPGRLRYDACLRLRLPLPSRGELATQVLPGGRHAVFLHRGPHAGLPETYRQIYGAWLPSCGEALAESPSFEVYLDHPQRTPPSRLRTEIHLPLAPVR